MAEWSRQIARLRTRSLRAFSSMICEWLLSGCLAVDKDEAPGGSLVTAMVVLTP